ncbi:MAG: hypothetical protein ACRDN9_20695, partial [Streptosporangiaceae bacterium]
STGTLDELSEGLSGTSTSFRSVVTEVASGVRQSGSHLHGDPQAALLSVSRPVQSQGTELARAALLACGVLTLWSRAVDEYDAGVKRLNRRWEQTSATGFGVPAADYSEAKTPEARESVTEAHAAYVATARAALLHELRIRRARLERQLDDVAEDAAGRLERRPSASNIEALLVAGALPAGAFELFPGIRLNAAQLRAMKSALKKAGQLRAYFASPPGGATSTELGRLLDLARRMDLDPKDYKQLLQTYYVTKAAEKAGIDLRGWDPSKGASELRDTIEAVYAYYGRLYLDHPYMKWAGMANMIGPSFAGGFLDLSLIRKVADAAGGPLADLPYGVGNALPGPLGDLHRLSNLSEADVRFFETTLLGMQKDIFVDMAASHEAYLEGGMGAIREMADAGLFDDGDADQAVRSWQQIDEGRRTGDNAMLNAGNRGLLYREQHDIIDKSYQTMYDHPVTGPVMTYMMGAIGAPSIPGAEGLGEVSPLELRLRASPIPLGPSPEVVVQTPLPDGNIADFDTRWGLIEEDTLPAYLGVVDGDPAQAEEIIGSDVHDRIEEQRLVHRVDDIAGRFATDWDVRIEW